MVKEAISILQCNILPSNDSHVESQNGPDVSIDMPVPVDEGVTTNSSAGVTATKFGFWDCWLQCSGIRRMTPQMAVITAVIYIIQLGIKGPDWFNVPLSVYVLWLLTSDKSAIRKIGTSIILMYFFADPIHYPLFLLSGLIRSAIGSWLFREPA